MSGNWTPDQIGFGPEHGDVWRLEFRFSYHVLNQFDEGFQSLPGKGVKDLNMKSYRKAFEHLDALLQYAMDLFQLPEDQALPPDVVFVHAGCGFQPTSQRCDL